SHYWDLGNGERYECVAMGKKLRYFGYIKNPLTNLKYHEKTEIFNFLFFLLSSLFLKSSNLILKYLLFDIVYFLMQTQDPSLLDFRETNINFLISYERHIGFLHI